MSEAEDKFTEVVRLAMVSTLKGADAEMTDTLFESLVTSIVGSLKRGEWFIHAGEVREVGWEDVVDWLDTGVVFTIRASYTDVELEEDGNE